MQTKSKANSVITSRMAEGGAGIIFEVKGAGEFTLALANISEALQKRAMIHGLVQRVSDGGAMSRDKATGAAPAPEARLAAMKRIADHLRSGTSEWAITRDAGAPGPRGLDAVILAAVVEVTGKTTAEVRALVEGGAGRANVTPKVYLEALGRSDKIRPVVERIRGEATPVIDVDAELDELMGAGGEEGEELAGE